MREALGGSPEKSFEALREWNQALLKNATDLLGEADLLFDAKRYARALALAHFAMEEMGKVVFLMSLAVDIALGDEPDWKVAEKVWSSHGYKFELFHIVDLVTQAQTATALVNDLGLLQELEFRLAGRPLREMALYVDIDDGLVNVPSARFTEDVARLYLGTAFHTGKALVEVLAASSDRLERLVDHLSDPKARNDFDEAKADFMRRFTVARSKARQEVIRELRSTELPDQTI